MQRVMITVDKYTFHLVDNRVLINPNCATNWWNGPINTPKRTTEIPLNW